MTDITANTTAIIVTFLRSIGIPVEAMALPEDGLLPAMTVCDGVLLYDPDRLEWPGDLLHEAGHIAVTDPAFRPTVSEFDSDGGDEMAAIAWSYAAALAAGIDPREVFHDHGYRGGGSYLADNFAAGQYVGVPMLEYYGLAARDGDVRYPVLQRWLR